MSLNVSDYFNRLTRPSIPRIGNYTVNSSQEELESVFSTFKTAVNNYQQANVIYNARTVELNVLFKRDVLVDVKLARDTQAGVEYHSKAEAYWNEACLNAPNFQIIYDNIRRLVGLLPEDQLLYPIPFSSSSYESSSSSDVQRTIKSSKRVIASSSLGKSESSE